MSEVVATNSHQGSVHWCKEHKVIAGTLAATALAVAVLGTTIAVLAATGQLAGVVQFASSVWQLPAVKIGMVVVSIAIVGVSLVGLIVFKHRKDEDIHAVQKSFAEPDPTIDPPEILHVSSSDSEITPEQEDTSEVGETLGEGMVVEEEPVASSSDSQDLPLGRPVQDPKPKELPLPQDFSSSDSEDASGLTSQQQYAQKPASQEGVVTTNPLQPFPIRAAHHPVPAFQNTPSAQAAHHPVRAFQGMPPAPEVSLHDLAKTGDTTTIDQTIRSGSLTLESKDTEGRSLLEVAIINNQDGVVDLLLKKGAFNCFPNTDGLTPMHVAALEGSVGAIKLLKEANNVLLNSVSITGRWPIHYAIVNNQIPAIEELVELGAHVNGPLDSFGCTGDYNYLENPLHFAVGMQAAGAVKTLVRLGANRELKDSKGKTPLQLAEEIDPIDKRGEAVKEAILTALRAEN